MTGFNIQACREAITAGHSRFPLVRSVVLDGDTPVSAFARLHRGGHGFLLESLEGGERWARFSFLATEPSEVFRYRGTSVERMDDAGTWKEYAVDTKPLDHLGALLRETTAPAITELPRFTGGAVGFWGYDVVRSIESLPNPPEDDPKLPDAVVLMVDTLLVLDALYHRATVISNIRIEPGLDDAELEHRAQEASRRAEEWIDRLSAPSGLKPLNIDTIEASDAEPTSPYRAQQYQRDVTRCQEHIAAGDAFQIVLSRRLDIADAPDPFLTYRWLRALNPAPYCYYLQLGELAIVGASPEVLVRVEHGDVTVRPIAGTRPRGVTQDEDLALEVELQADPKELAEHMMLLDLGRNDVGRVSEWGAVEVVQERVIERYSRVMHLVSEVRGRLRTGLDALDALAATFPAGTVSGAPKVRAMEIIDSLEPTRRGPYAGAVGYVGYGATVLDTAIAIRTAVFSGDTVSVQAGAGIVADSVPANEFSECEAKAGAVVRAIGLAMK